MKKTYYLVGFLSLLSTSLFAQIGGIEDSVNDVSDTIRTIFPKKMSCVEQETYKEDYTE